MDLKESTEVKTLTFGDEIIDRAPKSAGISRLCYDFYNCILLLPNPKRPRFIMNVLELLLEMSKNEDK